jgi:hypothetical protein
MRLTTIRTYSSKSGPHSAESGWATGTGPGSAAPGTAELAEAPGVVSGTGTEAADTPAKRIYLTIQLMYTSKEPQIYHERYFSLVRDITKAAPSVWPYIESINNLLLTGEMYKALKDAKKLIAYEQGLLENAKRGTGVRSGGTAGRKSA